MPGRQFSFVAVAISLAVLLAAGHRLPQRVITPVTPWEYRFTKAEAKRDHARVLTPAMRDASFSFAPGTADADRRAFLDAITGVRPDAQRIVGLVDGLVTVQFGTEQRGAFGHAGPTGDRFE